MILGDLTGANQNTGLERGAVMCRYAPQFN